MVLRNKELNRHN